MQTVLDPFLLYGAVVLGAIGVAIALPRKRTNPKLFGALLAAAAGGLVLLGLGFADPSALPNIHFYFFAFVALASALRMITHPRPVYAALFFILTILSSAGMYLLLSAEFMAFALVIIYAGAILITYLFVIMLATQAPSEEELEALAEYDVAAREPVAATVTGFVLIAALTTMLFSGTAQLPEVDASARAEALAEQLAVTPGRIERELRSEGLMTAGESLVMRDDDPALANLIVGEGGTPVIAMVRDGDTIREVTIPEGFGTRNVESLALNFLNDHPGTIEIAGVILMMAMLGATVLSRRQVQLDEEEKARQAAQLAAQAAGKGEA